MNELFFRTKLACWVMTALQLFCFYSHAKEPRASQKPNVIFILADDLGYGHLGCYGQTKILTPNIDKLSAEGMRFTQCYAGSHVCAPSRSTLMTGLHTGHTPIRSNGGDKSLYDGDVTVAEVLKDMGYTTGGFGKWGLGLENSEGRPTRQGFDEFFGFLHQVHAHFHYPYWLWKNDEKFFLPENEGKKQVRYAQDEIQKQTLDFIRRNRAKQFFCYLPYTLPHVELVVPEDSVQPYRGKWEDEPLPDPRPGYVGAKESRATFAGMVSRLDQNVGELLALLKDLKLDENTIVFFAGDNGPQGNQWQKLADFFDGNGPLRGYKGEFYEGGIRVPMIVRWPGKIKAKSVSDHICAFWDFLPTAAALAGAESPKGIDGISFVPTLLGTKGQRSHPFLYWEMPQGNKLSRAIRMQDWKAVQSKADGPFELYNLKSDLAERRSVVTENSAVMKQIESYLATARTEERKLPPENHRPSVKDYVR
ncbi:MAG: arylsulfatase [Verrucomicrobiota bacterium]